MSLTRFSVSIDRHLVERFDRKLASDRYPTRSKAVGDLIRASMVETEWKKGSEVAGAIVMVYDHRRRELMGRLTDVQHDHHHTILSTQHLHLDHDNCLEIIAVRGRPDEISGILRQLKALKGIKHVSLAAGTTGRQLT